MGLLVRIEQPVHRVATRSSTKNRELERRARKGRRRTRSKEERELDDSSSDSSFSPEIEIELDRSTPIVAVEKGVGEDRIPRDISRETREVLAESEPTPEHLAGQLGLMRSRLSSNRIPNRMSTISSRTSRNRKQMPQSDNFCMTTQIIRSWSGRNGRRRGGENSGYLQWQ